MDLNLFRETNRIRAKVVHPASAEWTLSDWLVAVMGELGEAANVVKKMNRGDFLSRGDHLEAVEEIAKELADVVTYLDIFADKLGISLSRACVDKFNEVSDRLECQVYMRPDGSRTSDFQ